MPGTPILMTGALGSSGPGPSRTQAGKNLTRAELARTDLGLSRTWGRAGPGPEAEPDLGTCTREPRQARRHHEAQKSFWFRHPSSEPNTVRKRLTGDG